MKTSSKNGKASAAKPKKSSSSGAARSRKMEPVKAKELKNQRFDDVDDEEDVDPEVIEGDLAFDDEFIDDDDDDE